VGVLIKVVFANVPGPAPAGVHIPLAFPRWELRFTPPLSFFFPPPAFFWISSQGDDLSSHFPFSLFSSPPHSSLFSSTPPLFFHSFPSPPLGRDRRPNAPQALTPAGTR